MQAPCVRGSRERDSTRAHATEYGPHNPSHGPAGLGAVVDGGCLLATQSRCWCPARADEVAALTFCGLTVKKRSYAGSTPRAGRRGSFSVWHVPPQEGLNHTHRFSNASTSFSIQTVGPASLALLLVACTRRHTLPPCAAPSCPSLTERPRPPQVRISSGAAPNKICRQVRKPWVEATCKSPRWRARGKPPQLARRVRAAAVRPG